jgi:hypothetical protein
MLPNIAIIMNGVPTNPIPILIAVGTLHLFCCVVILFSPLLVHENCSCTFFSRSLRNFLQQEERIKTITGLGMMYDMESESM